MESLISLRLIICIPFFFLPNFSKRLCHLGLLSNKRLLTQEMFRCLAVNEFAPSSTLTLVGEY